MPKVTAAPKKSEDKSNRKQRILDIATEEFAANGLAGTRVDVIARKARCNKQLIYYYFGGKEKLYDEVLANMMATTRQEESVVDTEASLSALAARRGGVGEKMVRRWRRLLTWEGLDGNGRKIVREQERAVIWRREVAMVEALQANGQLAPDLDAEMLAVVVHGMRMFPAVMPQVTKMTCGLTPDDPQFNQRYDEVVEQVVSRLAPTAKPAARKRAAGKR